MEEMNADVGEALQERLIREFIPKIRYMAYRLSFRLQPHMDMNDLISAGVIGLMDAMGKYDPSKNALFKTYAEFRIRGAMLDEIRAMDWVPRTIRDKTNLLKRKLVEMERKLKRSPREDEMADAFSMSLPAYREFILQTREATLIPIDDVEMGMLHDGAPFFPNDSVSPPREGFDPLTVLLSEDTKKILSKAIERLPGKERTVVSLYYFNELTMKEIGKVLNLTESRISQLHHHAISLLRANLQDFA